MCKYTIQQSFEYKKIQIVQQTPGDHMLLHANPTVVNIQGNNIFHILHHSYESKNLKQ